MVMEATAQTQRQNKFLLVALVIGAVVALIIIAGFASLFVYVPYNRMANGPKADARLKDLETEFRQIAPIPGANQLEVESSHKISVGGVSGDYKTNKSYETIRAHYDKELKNHGWTFMKERPVTIWWHDYGGKEAIYCKGIDAAVLQYAGEQPGVEWTYHFGMSWGLFDECR